MTAIDWMTVFAGSATIFWVNWYFFGSRRDVATVGAPAGVTEPDATDDSHPAAITITVQGGYSPRVIRAKVGHPIRLIFDRKESSGCSEEVVFPDFGIRRFLPAFQQTVVDVAPPGPGRYAFMCGMSMIRGELVVEA